MVTPQNSAPIPTAARSGAGSPRKGAIAAPSVAPINQVGTISPPLYPQDSGRVVTIILSKNALSPIVAPVKQDSITAAPVLL